MGTLLFWHFFPRVLITTVLFLYFLDHYFSCNPNFHSKNCLYLIYIFKLKFKNAIIYLVLRFISNIHHNAFRLSVDINFKDFNNYESKNLAILKKCRLEKNNMKQNVRKAFV